MEPIYSHLFLVVLALLAIVTGLGGSPLRVKSSDQTDIQNHSRLSELRNQIKARERHHYNGHDIGHHTSDEHNKHQLESVFEWPKEQFGSVPDYKPQPAYKRRPAYKPYDNEPQRPYSPLQTPGYDPSSFIYPLVYYTEAPTPAAYSPPSHSTQTYPEFPFFPVPYDDTLYTPAPQTQHPPLYYKDFERSPAGYHGTGHNDKGPGTNSDASTGFTYSGFFEFPKFGDFF